MRQWILAILVGVIMAPAVTADWLVLNDGSRLETRGHWQVKGKMVVFTRPQGQLSSMPLRDVDLDKSRQASAPVAVVKTKPTTPKAPRRPVAVLTNDDIPSARRSAVPASAPSSQGAMTASAFEPGQDAFGEPIELAKPNDGVRWYRVKEGGFEGVEVVGTLENDGEGIVTDLGVMVSLRDGHNQVIAKQRAVVQARSLMPGSYTRFQARFADLDIEDDEQTNVEVHCQAKRLLDHEKGEKGIAKP